jgi:uncharacterized protein (DUF433 family)
MAKSLSTEHLEIVQGARGPKVRIKGSRIRVIDVAMWYEEHGRTVDDIVQSFPQLTRADVFAALAYYWDHRDELEAKEAVDEAFTEEVAQRNPSLIQERLSQPSVG